MKYYYCNTTSQIGERRLQQYINCSLYLHTLLVHEAETFHKMGRNETRCACHSDVTETFADISRDETFSLKSWDRDETGTFQKHVSIPSPDETLRFETISLLSTETCWSPAHSWVVSSRFNWTDLHNIILLYILNYLIIILGQ